MSWSEFDAGTLQAQLGYSQGESRGLNLAEIRFRSVPGKITTPVCRQYGHVRITAQRISGSSRVSNLRHDGVIEMGHKSGQTSSRRLKFFLPFLFGAIQACSVPFLYWLRSTVHSWRKWNN